MTNNFGILRNIIAIGIMVVGTLPIHSKKKITEVTKRPNVLIINVDDLGYGDPSCYGGKLFQTPNIDRLADEGVKFTDGYVSAPVCSPSRHGLLTGCYQQRFGIQWNHDTWTVKHKENDRVVPLEHKHIDQAFSDAGYVTAMAGKINMEDYPNTTFDYEYSLTASGCHFFPDENGNYAGVDGAKKPKGGWTMMQWGPEREGEEYLTDRCGRQCIEFMDAHKDEPFFFYLAFNAVHTPLHAKKVDKPRVAHIESEAMKLYAAMALSIDDNVGKILEYLDKSKLRENTIVVFLSDNGPANPIHLRVPDWWPEGSPLHVLGQRAGLNGYKGTFWEAGIRVPYIISWPGQLEQGKVYNKAVSTLDIYPTMCAAADVKLPENTHLDGVNLLPYLKGNYKEDPHEGLFWYANRMGAARMGKWKLLIEDGVHYLFDLENDVEEKNNVLNKYPEVTTDMVEAYINFRNEMPAYRNPFRRPIDIPDPAVKKLPVLDPK